MEKELLKIINHYGINNQLKYIHSEYFELDEAIINCNTFDEFAQADMHVYDNNRQYYRKHIIEELADVMVMLKQFQYYYEIDDEDIETIMQQKIERQLKRIEVESNER